MSINEKNDNTYMGYSKKWGAHLNFMRGISFDINNPLVRLYSVAASCLFGEPSYYRGKSEGKVRVGYGLANHIKTYLSDTLTAADFYNWRPLSPSDLVERCIDAALDFDPEATLKMAVDLRQRDNLRVTPQVILVRAANHPAVKGVKPGNKSEQSLISKYASEIIRRADEPATQLAYQLKAFGKPVPNSLKRAWTKYLKWANEYRLAKYRLENKKVKTVDVGNIASGKGLYGNEGAIGKLMRDELRLTGSNRTWESMRSEGEPWSECIPVMGHMALLRNVKNFIDEGLSSDLWLPKLIDTTKNGKQLPFRYYTAYQKIKHNPYVTSKILDSLEEMMLISLGELGTIPGHSLVLTDNSGSATGCPISEMASTTVATIGNLMGVLTAHMSEDGDVGVFGDRLEIQKIRKLSSIFDELEDLNQVGHGIGGGTEHGIWLAFDDAIKNHIHYDNIFVYSDMQAGHGGLYGFNSVGYRWRGVGHRNSIDVPKLVKIYREVNPNVNVFLVQIAGYEDTLMPEYYDRTYVIGGWSGYILKFAAKMTSLKNN